MKRYVAGLVFSPNKEEVVLIKKNYSPNVSGVYNAIGGAIEHDDLSYSISMSRKFQEEVGLFINPNQWRYMGLISGEEFEVYWYETTVIPEEFDSIHAHTNEEIIKVAPSYALNNISLLEHTDYYLTLALEPLGFGSIRV